MSSLFIFLYSGGMGGKIFLRINIFIARSINNRANTAS